VELKEYENLVRSYLLNQNPTSHRFGEITTGSFSCRPEPDEAFDFPGGCVAVEYETGRPVQCVQKYWWLLNRTDFLPEDKKLSLVVIMADPEAQPKDQVERQKKLAEELEQSLSGRFRCFFVGGDDVKPQTVSDAVAQAYETVKA
jgi:hypothetical protein